MTRILLVRHGETAANRDRVFRGRWDLPLNQTGLAEADATAAYLAGESIDRILVSPLKRAAQTAEAIAKTRGIPVEPDDAFLDVDYGLWTRQPSADILARETELHRAWETAPQTVRFPEGESLADVEHRAFSRLRELAADHDGDGALVFVSHRVVLKVLLYRALDLTAAHFWRIRVDTASVSRLAFDDGTFTLIASNLTDHLRPVHPDPPLADF